MSTVDQPIHAAERPSQRRARAGYLFIAPNLAAVAVFMLFPLGFSLYMSFQEWDLFRPARFVGLANFHNLFTADPLFPIAMRNTVVFTIGTIVPTVVISLVVAGVLNRKVKGIGIFRTIVFCRWRCRRWSWRSCGSSCSTPITGCSTSCWVGSGSARSRG